MLSLGVVSLIDRDPTFSRMENRVLPGFPKFTFSGFLEGSFTQALVQYYAETFPGRETLAVKRYELNQFFAPSFFSQEQLDAVLSEGEENTSK